MKSGLSLDHLGSCRSAFSHNDASLLKKLPINQIIFDSFPTKYFLIISLRAGSFRYLGRCPDLPRYPDNKAERAIPTLAKHTRLTHANACPTHAPRTPHARLPPRFPTPTHLHPAPPILQDESRAREHQKEKQKLKLKLKKGMARTRKYRFSVTQKLASLASSSIFLT